MTQALVLALVGIGITSAVYGVVALIVKADDWGVPPCSVLAGSGRAVLLSRMPVFLTILCAVGTAAMIWAVNLTGLEVYAPPSIGLMVHAAAETAAHAARRSRIVEDLGVLGLLIGAATIPLLDLPLNLRDGVEKSSAGPSNKLLDNSGPRCTVSVGSNSEVAAFRREVRFRCRTSYCASLPT